VKQKRYIEIHWGNLIGSSQSEDRKAGRNWKILKDVLEKNIYDNVN
jgi:hypothetical protein